MFFNSVAEIAAAIEELPTTCDGKRTQYPVLFKKAVCEYMQRNNVKPCQLTSGVRMTAALLGRWQNQFDEGLYTMEGVYNVSKKSLSSNQRILQQLNTEANLLQRKIELVKQCEELGIAVSMPNE